MHAIISNTLRSEKEINYLEGDSVVLKGLNVSRCLLLPFYVNSEQLVTVVMLFFSIPSF